uniref:FAM194 C-terminal domain-containing protein n=2 Tax=Clastoptera arizonana TaxID=38151 RepID=A0A1B6EGC8_9HEMI
MAGKYSLEKNQPHYKITNLKNKYKPRYISYKEFEEIKAMLFKNKVYIIKSKLILNMNERSKYHLVKRDKNKLLIRSHSSISLTSTQSKENIWEFNPLSNENDELSFSDRRYKVNRRTKSLIQGGRKESKEITSNWKISDSRGETAKMKFLKETTLDITTPFIKPLLSDLKIRSIQEAQKICSERLEDDKFINEGFEPAEFETLPFVEPYNGMPESNILYTNQVQNITSTNISSADAINQKNILDKGKKSKEQNRLKEKQLKLNKLDVEGEKSMFSKKTHLKNKDNELMKKYKNQKRMHPALKNKNDGEIITDLNKKTSRKSEQIKKLLKANNKNENNLKDSSEMTNYNNNDKETKDINLQKIHSKSTEDLKETLSEKKQTISDKSKRSRSGGKDSVKSRDKDMSLSRSEKKENVMHGTREISDGPEDESKDSVTYKKTKRSGGGGTDAKTKSISSKLKTNISEGSRNKNNFSKDGKRMIQKVNVIIHAIYYQLSDKKFMELGWTLEPTDTDFARIVTFRTHPANPKTYAFRNRDVVEEKFYKNGNLAYRIELDSTGKLLYNSGHIAMVFTQNNLGNRITIYTEPNYDDVKSTKSRILGAFDSFGNGVIYDDFGKIR